MGCITAFINGVVDFATETFVVFGPGFADELASGTSPAALIFGTRSFGPFFDAMNMEDLVAFAVTMPSGVLGFDSV